MPIYKKVNKKFFKVWSKDMAYVLGFLTADGYITHNKRGAYFWCIQITDKGILEKIKKVIESDHKISSRPSRNKNEKNLYRLQIGSKEMCDDLIKLGLTERKSKTIKMPHIPKKYFPDFLRGYFDGDGGVWFGLKNKSQKGKTYTLSSFFTSGSINFLISLRGILNNYGIVGGSLVKKDRGFDLKYSVKNSLILYKIMYNDNCSLFLKRKRDRFEKYINMRS